MGENNYSPKSLECLYHWGAYTAVSIEVNICLNSLFRDWVDYRDGFGDFKLWNDEFWLGNEHMYSLLSDGQKIMKCQNIFL